MSKAKASVSVTIGKKAIQDALKAVNPSSYAEKTDALLNRVAQEGKNLIEQNLSFAKIEYPETLTCSVYPEKRGQSIRFKIEGKNILFAEYGAGVAASTDVHPTGKYGQGTYPGQTHAFDPNGWYYVSTETHKNRLVYRSPEGFNVYHTFGNAPTAFVYKSIQQLKDKLPELAKGIK